MTPINGKVSTKTFYKALLEITPQLQKINDNLDQLNSESKERTGQIKGIIDRVIAVEKIQAVEATKRKTWNTIGRFLYAIAILAIGLMGALIGKSF